MARARTHHSHNLFTPYFLLSLRLYLLTLTFNLSLNLLKRKGPRSMGTRGAREASRNSGNRASQNPLPNLGIKTEISRLWSIPDHQEGIRCKAPRSDD
jgi:hypothetical protein